VTIANGVTNATKHDGGSPSAVRLLFSRSAGPVLVIAGLGLFGGFTEAAVLLIIVRSALAITDQSKQSLVELPVLGSLSVATAVLVGATVLLLRLGLQLGAAWISASAFARARLQWLGEVVEHSLLCQWEDVADQPEGTLSELASAVVRQAATAILYLALAAQQAGSLAILLAATFLVNAPAALITLMSVLVLAVAIRPLGQLIRRQAARSIKEEQHLATGVAEVTRSLLEIRAFGVEPAVQGRLMASAVDTARSWHRVNFSSQTANAVYQAAALALILGGIAVLGRGSPGQLAGLGTVVLILIRAFAYGQQLQAQLAALQGASPAVLLLDDALRSLPATTETPATHAVPRPFSRLQLRGIGYWYHRDQTVLKGFDMVVGAGDVIGLRGPSGTGKTTLLHLLLGLRMPREGTFNVDGVDISTINRRAWSTAVGFVPQEPMLIEGSIAENIRFFRSGLSDGQVQGAALRAGLGPDLAGWPEGLARLVGQRRHGVSGGQRQRITIARALAGDPVILLMDEPTSSLDEEAERVILETLQALKGQLTVVVAAHRVSTLALCDRIVDLDRSGQAPVTEAAAETERTTTPAKPPTAR